MKQTKKVGETVPTKQRNTKKNIRLPFKKKTKRINESQLNEETKTNKGLSTKKLVIIISVVVFLLIAFTVAVALLNKDSSLFKLNNNSADESITRVIEQDDSEKDSKNELSGKGSYIDDFLEKKENNDYYALWH